MPAAHRTVLLPPGYADRAGAEHPAGAAAQLTFAGARAIALEAYARSAHVERWSETRVDFTAGVGRWIGAWKDPGTATERDGVYRFDPGSNTKTFILRGDRTNRIEFHGAPYSSGQRLAGLPRREAPPAVSLASKEEE